jgi:hypothetical protein
MIGQVFAVVNVEKVSGHGGTLPGLAKIRINLRHGLTKMHLIGEQGQGRHLLRVHLNKKHSARVGIPYSPWHALDLFSEYDRANCSHTKRDLD